MTEHSAARNTALVFDWGGTLMKEFQQYTGPMVNWPEVAVIDGVSEALTALCGNWNMVVATNATESDATLVWQALNRVNLSEYFKAVFTAREMDGAQKPALRFFRQLESVLDCAPHHLVMIGDDYRKDMLGAKSAGWRSLWFNPEYKAADGMIPLHDAEVHHLRDLPPALRNMTLPDYGTCLAWLASRGTPFNILGHINLVASTAYQLALWLAQAGETVDPLLTHRGGMLHDLGKIDSIRAGKERGPEGDHAALARSMLLEKGQPELAEIADRHMIYDDPAYARRPVTWEQKLVNYADKLADGSQLVSIEQRIEGLKVRYPQAAASFETSMVVLGPLQEEICARLGSTPEQLAERLRESLGFMKL